MLPPRGVRGKLELPGRGLVELDRVGRVDMLGSGQWAVAGCSLLSHNLSLSATYRRALSSVDK